MLFHQNKCKTGHDAVQMSQAFHDIAWFERFTELNLFKYVFNVIQKWEMGALQVLQGGAYLLFAGMVEGDKSNQAKDG